MLDVSAKPVNATVLKQYIATTMKPATTRAKSDFLAILSFLSRLSIPSFSERKRANASEVHLDDNGSEYTDFESAEPAFTPCIEAYGMLS